LSTDRNVDIPAARARLGRVGAWFGAMGRMTAAEERDIAVQLEELGYSTLWITETQKDIFAHAALLLAVTDHMTIASGIANVWSREPETPVAGTAALSEAWDNRFLLGVGIGHAKFVERYDKPLQTMRDYLARMHAATYLGPAPSTTPPWLIAALRPKMLELAVGQADGSCPYFVPVEHTALAREALGPDKILAPELGVVLDTDPTTARETARRFAQTYLALPNYVNNLRALGWSEDDVAAPGSDRLIDAVVAWGDIDAIKRRVDEHLAAGADHVAIQAVDFRGDTAIRTLTELAPALIGA
jgi:probable F420-dependent oxidoreductase